MVFSSALFLFGFLPILLLIYYFANHRYQNLVLLVASIVFYAWGEPKYVFLMLFSILVNFFLGLFIERTQKLNKLFLITALIFDLGILFVFKYLNFAVDSLNLLAGTSVIVPEIALPIGISFFTFQIMSYVIDVYRKNAAAQKNILNLALYISLFPQLIAGPIVRYVDIEEQICNRRTSAEKFTDGIIRFSIGFSKKILIADQLSTYVDTIFSGVYPSMLGNWVGILAYTIQIYFDFSGYSDMAIGLGKMFGFDFLENFNYPYISKSIKEFWRRWHISLSSWFRDYLYIPLGGSRQGTARTYFNLLVVFALTGLWHGASANFIVWGIFYAVFLIAERMGLEKLLKRLPQGVQHLYTLLIVMFGWVFFRAENLGHAIEFIKGMFVPHGMDLANFAVNMNPQYAFCLLAGIFFSFPHEKLKMGLRKLKILPNHICDISVFSIFLLAICYMIGSGYSPFLYFRF